MIIELTVNNEKQEKIRVRRENGKYFISFIDSKDDREFEANFEECGDFYSVILDGKPYMIKFADNGDISTVSSGASFAKIKAENQESRLRKDLKDSLSIKTTLLKSKIPGKILGININIGDIVEPGDCLLTLEAMKMENKIFSPRQAKVKNIFVKKDQIIAIGADLVSFEA